jgi:hypothetical protein
MDNKLSFEEIIQMITSACNTTFINGTRDIRNTVLECATRIYIAQMIGGAE